MPRKKSGLECNECGENINPKRPFVIWSVVKETKGEEEVLDDVAAFHPACFELIVHDLNERAIEDDDDELGPEADGSGFEEVLTDMFKRILTDFENAKRGYSYGGTAGAERRETRPPKDAKNATGMTHEEACRILQVPLNASDEVIKAAWRKRARELHPDLNKEKDTTDEFKKARMAYETLNGE